MQQIGLQSGDYLLESRRVQNTMKEITARGRIRAMLACSMADPRLRDTACETAKSPNGDEYHVRLLT